MPETARITTKTVRLSGARKSNELDTSKDIHLGSYILVANSASIHIYIWRLFTTFFPFFFIFSF